MEEKKGVRLALVASGSGTDADSIMRAWKGLCIPEVSDIYLVSTKVGAGCIEKANKLDIGHQIISCKGPSESVNFSVRLFEFFDLRGIDLVFLVGCVHRVIKCRSNKEGDPDMYNIHPADPHQHGGQGMYGLKVHEHVLLKIQDAIVRGKVKVDDQFFTHPTVHVAEEEYDSGDELLIGQIEIPSLIIKNFVEERSTLSAAAKQLQAVVLPYEWLMLPTAVRMAAKKIIDRKNGG